jgi:hypothetical protein
MDVLLSQTNLQFYKELRLAGISAAEIMEFQKDYETACLLFSPLNRSTGRPFLCHAVGTASAALKEGADFLDVRAALLHAAYKHGRFPDRKKKKTPAHTVWLTQRCGEDLADLLAAFSGFSFSPKSVHSYLDSGDLPQGLTLRLIRIKLANDVDDSHAYGGALAHKARYKDPTWLQMRLDLSQKLGFAFFEAAFAQALEECNDGEWLDTTTVFERRGAIRSIPGQLAGRLSGKGYC